MYPKARKEKIVIRKMADETLVYDDRNHKAHCLNAVSAFIWQQCDGRHSVSQLAELVEEAFGIEQAESVVQLALEQLSQRDLLQKPVQRLSGTARLARRDALKKLAVAISVPVIMTVTAKGARAAVSLKGSGIPCAVDSECKSHHCVHPSAGSGTPLSSVGLCA